MESIRIGKGEGDFISIDDLLEDYIYIREERDEFIYVVRDLLYFYSKKCKSSRSIFLPRRF